MNVEEILRGCPSDIRLYSPIYGELSLVSVLSHNSIYPILCRVLKSGNAVSYTEDGKNNISDAELTLFPSKEQRDWNKFGLTDHEAKHQFKPFDKVLVRDYNDNEWKCDFFSNMNEHGYYNCINTWWHQCISYEGNEHLLGTTNDPE